MLICWSKVFPQQIMMHYSWELDVDSGLKRDLEKSSVIRYFFYWLYTLRSSCLLFTATCIMNNYTQSIVSCYAILRWLDKISHSRRYLHPFQKAIYFFQKHRHSFRWGNCPIVYFELQWLFNHLFTYLLVVENSVNKRKISHFMVLLYLETHVCRCI